MNRQARRRDDKAARRQQDLLSSGVALQQKGDLAGARKRYRQALAVDPDHPDANRLLGELLLNLRQLDEAIPLLRHVAKLLPAHFGAQYSLANAYRLARDGELAVQSYRAALALEPDFAGALHGMGAALNLLERESEAIAWLRRAVHLRPDFAAAWQDLGAALAVMGELTAAEDAFTRAAALDPRLGNVRRMLATMRRDRPEDGEIAALLAAAAHEGTPPKPRIEMLFAAGRLLDQGGEADRAFAAFTRANQLRRAGLAESGIRYDQAGFSRDVDRLITAFDAAYFDQKTSAGHPSDAPVFILGMPRTGSSLIEQIAASHAQVTGAGEYAGIGEIAGRLSPAPDSWQAADLAAAARGYLEGVTAKAGAAARIIDKMPENILHLGLIANLFPNARVIFTERDMQDTCLSCFFQNFAASLAFDADLDDAAHRWGETARLARHWQEVLPLRHITMRYEAVVADLPGQARRLIDFLGLDWDDACLDFHRAARPVRTASWAQVRQPIYQDGVGRWRRYAHLLPPGWGQEGV
jgi:tetratricopeptide (TPR) repeat protein